MSDLKLSETTQEISDTVHIRVFGLTLYQVYKLICFYKNHTGDVTLEKLDG